MRRSSRPSELEGSRSTETAHHLGGAPRYVDLYRVIAIRVKAAMRLAGVTLVDDA
jgi:hypothetical protein